MLTGVKAVETFCVVSTAFNFAPQTATNRLCGLCSSWSGHFSKVLFERHRAKSGGLLFHVFWILYYSFQNKVFSILLRLGITIFG